MSTVTDTTEQAVLDTALAAARDLIPISPFRDEASLKQWLGRKIIADLRDKVPQKVYEAKWLDLTGHSETGINVELLSGSAFSIKAFLGAMIGMNSAGLNVSIPIYSSSRVLMAIGVGRTFSYDDFKKQSNVIIASARFTL